MGLTGAGDQHPEHERRAGVADVQELPEQRAHPLGRSVIFGLKTGLTRAETDGLKEPS